VGKSKGKDKSEETSVIKGVERGRLGGNVTIYGRKAGGLLAKSSVRTKWMSRLEKKMRKRKHKRGAWSAKI